MAVNNLRCYKGNPNLKGLHVKLDLTKEQLDEYIKCANDVIYFTKKYVKIVHVDLGLIPFNLRDYQEDLIEKFRNNRFVICKMARQTGKSVTTIAYMLWFILFHSDKNVAVLANKQSLAIELLDRLKLAYEHLPWFLQQGVVTWNKTKIEIENGSKIMAAATSSSSVRGNSFSCIFLDEFAHIRPKLAEEFFASVYPTISSGQTTQVIIVSTPKGMNHFYKIWQDAVAGINSYVTAEVHYSRVPGRDTAWKEREIANTSARQFAQEHDCSFLGSAGTLIEADKLTVMPGFAPVKQLKTQHTEDMLDIIEEPKEGHVYVLAADVAEGIGIDFSAFSVFDVTAIPYKQVAKYRSNRISEILYPDVLWGAARIYNEAMVLIENNTGREVANILELELEYENIISVSATPRYGQQVGGGYSGKSQAGVRMDKKIKRIGCNSLKTLVESDKLQVTDFETIQELFTFVQVGKSYEADSGFHDDLAMTLVLFSWLTTQEFFKDLTNIDVRKKLLEDRVKAVEDEVIPFIDMIQSTNAEEVVVDKDGQMWEVVNEDEETGFGGYGIF